MNYGAILVLQKLHKMIAPQDSQGFYIQQISDEEQGILNEYLKAIINNNDKIDRKDRNLYIAEAAKKLHSYNPQWTKRQVNIYFKNAERQNKKGQGIPNPPYAPFVNQLTVPIRAAPSGNMPNTQLTPMPSGTPLGPVPSNPMMPRPPYPQPPPMAPQLPPNINIKPKKNQKGKSDQMKLNNQPQFMPSAQLSAIPSNQLLQQQKIPSNPVTQPNLQLKAILSSQANLLQLPKKKGRKSKEDKIIMEYTQKMMDPNSLHQKVMPPQQPPLMPNMSRPMMSPVPSNQMPMMPQQISQSNSKKGGNKNQKPTPPQAFPFQGQPVNQFPYQPNGQMLQPNPYQMPTPQAVQGSTKKKAKRNQSPAMMPPMNMQPQFPPQQPMMIAPQDQGQKKTKSKNQKMLQQPYGANPLNSTGPIKTDQAEDVVSASKKTRKNKK